MNARPRPAPESNVDCERLLTRIFANFARLETGLAELESRLPETAPLPPPDAMAELSDAAEGQDPSERAFVPRRRRKPR